MTTVINLYGGPCSGKSTQAAGLFYTMKQQGYSVELVNEFAKEVVWEGNVPMLKDQLWVLAHQHRKLVRLKDKVDYIITDSPVLLSIAYRGIYDGPMYSDLIDQLALECYNMYNNIDVFLKRPSGFIDDGRAQDEVTSEQIDSHIIQILDKLNINYVDFPVNGLTVQRIMSIL